MKFHKEHRPARTIYRIDRTLHSGEVLKYYGSEVYDTCKAAEKAAARRFSKYPDQLSVVAVHEEASDVFVSDVPFRA